METTRIKFCGITQAADALEAVRLGVDALGFVFYPPSPRYIEPQAAAAIIRQLPPFVCTVGLFVNEPSTAIERIISLTAIDLVQFHGDESPTDCERVSRRWIKALRMHEDVDLRAAQLAYGRASALLLDGYDPHVYGGSGKVFDWSVVPRDSALPVILAGGLEPANVAEALRQTHAFAVDVSGGIEAQKGIKDADKMKQFIEEVRNLERQA